MKMMRRLVYAFIALVITTTATSKHTTTNPRTTTVFPRSNLNGKMATLSLNGGGISFYPRYFYASTPAYTTQTFTTTRLYPTRPTTTQTFTTTRPYPTRPTTTQTFTTTRLYPTRPTTTQPYTTTRPYPTRPTTTRRYTTRPYTTYPFWTTPPSTRGLSVCLRYLTDFQQTSNPSIFTLSPSSRTALKLSVSITGSYKLSWDRFSYYVQLFKPNIRFWSNIGPEMWTRLCLTVDTVKNVAQVFSGPNMSIRKVLPVQYVWSGEPVLDFAGFDGQVTDVQMWDYPIYSREIFNYMTRGVYGPYYGSVLTWSDINYSLRGNTLLENSYEWQENEVEKEAEEETERERKRLLKF